MGSYLCGTFVSFVIKAFQIGSLMVLRDRPIDLERQGQRGPAILNRYKRFSALPDSFKKGSQLSLQRLAGVDCRLLDVDAGDRPGAGGRAFASHQRHSRGLIHLNRDYILPGIVDRDVLMRLKKTQFADALRADPAGGEISHTSRLKLQSHIRDIHARTEHGQSHRTDLPHLRLYKREHDVEVMDHQIKDHVDIQRSRREDA